MGGVFAVIVLALVATPAAFAIDEYRVPEELRDHPATPRFSGQDQPRDRRISTDGLTSTDQPDYGDSAEVGSPVREALNADANAAGSEINTEVKELEPDDDAGDEALRKCVQNSLWDMLFDAVWDAATGTNFDLGSELGKTASRATQCIADKFHVGPVAAASASDWMMESVISHGADVLARDPHLSAFINWAAVMAWYSI